MSVYQIDKKNVLTTDLLNPNFSKAVRRHAPKGFELEGKRQPDQQSRCHRLVLAQRHRVHQGQRRAQRPPSGRHAADDRRGLAGLHPRADTAFAGLGAGIGARYTRGSGGTETADGHFTIPSYTLYDGKLSYDFEKSPLQVKGLKVQVNLENLEDKKYVSRCSSDLDATTARAVPSPPT